MTQTHNYEDHDLHGPVVRETTYLSSVDPEPQAAESVRDKHVTIVGINYWPEPTGIAPYTTQMAEHLARSAASVTVLTGFPSYPSWTVDEAYRGRLRMREERNGVQIIRLAHHVPKRQSALRRAAYEASFLMQACSVRLLRSPDVILAATPALGGAVAAQRIAARHGARLVVVVQDLMARASIQSGISGGSAVSGVTARLEGRALRSADAVALVASAFRPHVESYGVPADRLSLLPNWSHAATAKRDRRVVRDELGWSDDVTVALHTGNMGLKQDLGNIIEAARLSQGRPNLLWVLMGDGSQRAALSTQAGNLRNVMFLPPCAAEDYGDMLSAADILLLNERPSVGDMSLPSKLTSYFMSGRPVAAAVALDGSTAAELGRVDGALTVPAGQPEELVRLVTTLASKPQLARDLGRGGRRYAADNLSVGVAMRRLDSLLSLT